MAVLDPATRQKPKFIDKEWLRQQIADHNARTGFVPVPGATGETAQQLIAEEMRALGIDPLASRQIAAMREE